VTPHHRHSFLPVRQLTLPLDGVVSATEAPIAEDSSAR
jgi:hypothetical protein